MKVHVGELVQQKLEWRGMSKAEFARRMDMSPTNTQDLLKRDSWYTHHIEKASEVLDYNLYSDISPVRKGEVSEPQAEYLTKEKKIQFSLTLNLSPSAYGDIDKIIKAIRQVNPSYV